MSKDPRGCAICGKPCRRSVWFTVPAGWTRVRSERDGSVVLICPADRARVAREEH